MVKEAQAHADEDKKRREMVDLRNQADTLAYSLEKLLKDNRDKVDAGAGQGDRGGGGGGPQGDGGRRRGRPQEAVERSPPLSHKLAESLYKASGSRRARAGRTVRAVAAAGSGQGGGDARTTWSTPNTRSRSNDPRYAARARGGAASTSGATAT